ncbi:MAG TPA: BON domain-containing protein [Terriglobia bacterium]
MKPGLIYQRLVAAWLLVMVLGIAACSKAPTDDQITKAIQASYYADPQVKNDQITIDVKNGEVTLSGTVASDADHLQAYKLASQVAGVKKVTDQIQVGAAQAATPPESAAAPPTETAAAPPASATPSPAPAAAAPTPPPPPPPPPQPQPVTVQAGTSIRVQTIDAISSDTGQPGQTYQASLAAPIVVGDTVVVRKGATVYLQVTGASQAGKIKGSSELSLALDHLVYQGQSYPLASSAVQQVGQSRGKQTAKRAGLGAAIGAGIGAIAGGGKGAAIGAGVGGGGAMAYQAFTKGKAVKVAPETLLDFTLAQPVTIILPPKNTAPSQQ